MFAGWVSSGRSLALSNKNQNFCNLVCFARLPGGQVFLVRYNTRVTMKLVNRIKFESSQILCGLSVQFSICRTVPVDRGFRTMIFNIFLPGGKLFAVTVLW